MKNEPIYENNELYTAFPDPDEVFYSEVEKERFLPLGTFHLQTDEGQHDVLIATPLGDEEGLIGKDNYGEFCGETWLTYSKVNGKWKMDCSVDDLLNFDAYYEKANNGLKEAKKIFNENKCLPSRSSRGDGKIPLFSIQSYPSYLYNWFSDVEEYFNFALREVDKEELDSSFDEDKAVTLFDSEGNQYVYIGSTNKSFLMARLFFFYNVKAERVLVIFEYS
ncbi:hypothetical protein [Marinibactrum halimedae]|uniref:Uncharacterized protein n=1 Tax=Marinibactrum halimedae TaxID=1444977 RepID=A0AA37T3P7_9GAMM|nr:hypothetical protein [Marinibactrum halimedae]MCD9457695.1 hypothetical protein [Marinibactrum halimedae]GLS24931.1 hypothetical protein GCM10007877_06450 [Marinibactrum halimedae]